MRVETSMSHDQIHYRSCTTVKTCGRATGMGAAAAKEADAAALDATPPPIKENYALLDTPACAEATEALDVQRFLSLLAKLARHREALAAARLPNELPNEAQIAAELFS